MGRNLTIQTLCSALVIGAFIASEASARWLSIDPASPLAWRLNLELFRPFELARIETSPLRLLFGPLSLAGASALLVAALLAWRLRLQLGVAAIANVCFACVAALTYLWLKEAGAIKAASLGPALSARGLDGALVALMLASSLVACLVSHLSFVARIASDRRAATAAPRQ